MSMEAEKRDPHRTPPEGGPVINAGDARRPVGIRGLLLALCAGLAVLAATMIALRPRPRVRVTRAIEGAEAERFGVNRGEITDTLQEARATARVGHRYRVRIVDDSDDGGSGIARIGGLVTFVPDARGPNRRDRGDRRARARRQRPPAPDRIGNPRPVLGAGGRAALASHARHRRIAEDAVGRDHVFVTDRDGAVRLESDGASWRRVTQAESLADGDEGVIDLEVGL